jgi:predicted O-methyltransferase YrrM
MKLATPHPITTPILSQIEALVADVPGWSPIDQLYTLFQLAEYTSDLPGDVVEIGSWCGRSALALGLAARLTGRTKVHCIDRRPRLGTLARCLFRYISTNGRVLVPRGDR